MGAIFILASKYIGRGAIRAAMIAIIIFCVVNLKTSYHLSLKDKTTYLIALILSIISIYKPEFTMLILGIFLIYISLPKYVKAIKNRDFSDFLLLTISGTGILFGLFCILNSKSALKTVVILIGIIFTVAGCLTFYQGLIRKEKP